MTAVSTSFVLSLYIISVKSRTRAIALIGDVKEKDSIIKLARYISDLTSLIDEIDALPDDMQVDDDGNVKLDYDIRALIDLCADSEGELAKISTISLDLH